MGIIAWIVLGEQPVPHTRASGDVPAPCPFEARQS
jgi:hypothetical protein